MTFRFLLSTPDKTFFNGAAHSVICPTPDGYFGILPRHAQLVAAVGVGVIKVECEAGTRFFVVDGGVAEVTPEETAIMADLVISATDPADAEEKLEETKALRTVPVTIR
jgi:F-type H+-transporting ATPase subunit epsilon